MLNRGRLAGALVVALLALAPGSAPAAALHSPDDLAPPDAPAHWLPPEPWIYNHWLPFDEQRLYRVLHITRVQLWTQLRDDHRALAGLAARHGYREPAAPRRAASWPGARAWAATSRVPRSSAGRCA